MSLKAKMSFQLSEWGFVLLIQQLVMNEKALWKAKAEAREVELRQVFKKFFGQCSGLKFGLPLAWGGISKEAGSPLARPLGCCQLIRGSEQGLRLG